MRHKTLKLAAGLGSRLRSMSNCHQAQCSQACSATSVPIQQRELHLRAFKYSRNMVTESAGKGPNMRRPLIVGRQLASLAEVPAQDQGQQGFTGKIASALGAGTAACTLWNAISEPARAEGESTTKMEMKAPALKQADLDSTDLQAVLFYKEHSPSVVNITCVIDDLKKGERKRGWGSGFVWDNAGHVVTNHHVIANFLEGEATVRVTFVDQGDYKARVVGGDADKDIAVLHLEDCPEEKLKEMKPVIVGDSSAVMVGQRVYAIGNPHGLGHSFTQGIVSGIGRVGGTKGPRGLPIPMLIQTDAAINPGNSGGPLLDYKGRVIGINKEIMIGVDTSGISFAIPTEQARGWVEQILKHGQIIRPVMGISPAPQQVLQQLGIEGVLVLETQPGLPAAKAGIYPTGRDENGRLVLGDIITAINGERVPTLTHFFAAMDTCKEGQEVEVSLLRKHDGPETITLTLVSQECEKEAAGKASAGAAKRIKT